MSCKMIQMHSAGPLSHPTAHYFLIGRWLILAVSAAHGNKNLNFTSWIDYMAHQNVDRLFN